MNLNDFSKWLQYNKEVKKVRGVWVLSVTLYIYTVSILDIDTIYIFALSPPQWIQMANVQYKNCHLIEGIKSIGERVEYTVWMCLHC